MYLLPGFKMNLVSWTVWRGQITQISVPQFPHNNCIHNTHHYERNEVDKGWKQNIVEWSERHIIQTESIRCQIVISRPGFFAPSFGPILPINWNIRIFPPNYLITYVMIRTFFPFLILFIFHAWFLIHFLFERISS